MTKELNEKLKSEGFSPSEIEKIFYSASAQVVSDTEPLSFSRAVDELAKNFKREGAGHALK